MSALQEIVDRTEYNARVEHERACDADPFEACGACSDRRAAITSAREELRELRAENEAMREALEAADELARRSMEVLETWFPMELAEYQKARTALGGRDGS